jgi:thiol-disulfide isomerase/thioredoxin
MNSRLAFIGLCILLFGCDVIDRPQIDFLHTYDQGLYGPPPAFSPASANMIFQKVLIEDFTGHDCGNCPRAAIVATEQAEDYPGKIVVIAVHAGGLAVPTAEYPEDFTTTEGELYFAQLAQPYNPVGRINRSPDRTTSLFDPEWPDIISDRLVEEPTAIIQMVANYVPENNHLNIHAYTEFVKAHAGRTKIQLLITESHLTGVQLDYSIEDDPETSHNEQVVEDYEFEHVLRGAVNTPYGMVGPENPTGGTSDLKSYTYQWNDAWAVENCAIVAICYDDETGRILGVTELKLNE